MLQLYQMSNQNTFTVPQKSTDRRHLSSNADCFSELLQNLFLFQIMSFLTAFGFQFCTLCIAVV